MVPLIEVSRVVKLIGTEKKMLAARGWGGEMEYWVQWDQNFSFIDEKSSAIGWW